MTTCELVRDFGYSCETIQAATEDGYVLNLDRVRSADKTKASKKSQNGTLRNPIILIPGILSDSGLWFLNYPSQSLGE
ncbi:hypothetical protein HPB49_000860 [Dermacentor silvarum]|uniref:Uncharacterized protein n=1 Tax=Dermacentor silvarum TaxID=543639 RepID=A0ACB8C1W3_DERSI|nr:hypothetical protein HPB49_000860 [Dermacentor silvarum]